MNIKIFHSLFFLFVQMSIFAQTINTDTSDFKDFNWKDNNGNFINAHGAGMLKYNETYYLFGEIKTGKTWLVPNQKWEDYRVPAGGISCYSSKDLLHWRYEGIALKPTIGDNSSEIDTSRVIERPKVIFNERTKKFVMWMHIDKNDYSLSHAGVAISNNPVGPYKYIGSFRPNGNMSRDMTIYKDDDGKAYLIYASEGNKTMHICLLDEDYLSPSKHEVRILTNRNREAPALFKYDGLYFLITSLCTGWDPNKARYAVSNEMMGQWKLKGNPFIGKDAGKTFNAQGTFVFPLREKGRFLFMADKWNKKDLEKSTYLWLIFQMTMKKVVIRNKMDY